MAPGGVTIDIAIDVVANQHDRVLDSRGFQRSLRSPLGPLDRLQPAGQLALVGSSEMFKNGYLAAAGFQHDQLLLNLVAQLAFGPEMATLQARRSSPRGFAHQSSSAKVWWRVVVMGTAPLAFLALGMARYRRRRAPLRLT